MQFAPPPTHHAPPFVLRIAAVCALLCAGCSSPGTAPVEVAGTAGCVTDFSCPPGEECGPGGCAPIAPGLCPHIRLASAYLGVGPDAAGAQWRAAHYDLLIGKVHEFIEETRAVNPNAALFEYINMGAHVYEGPESTATRWARANGYDPEEFYLHYIEDVAVPTWEGIELVAGFPPGTVPGYNPSPTPTDPAASATARYQSRVPGFNDGSGVAQYLLNVAHPAVREFILHLSEQKVMGFRFGAPPSAGPIDGVLYDNAIYYPAFGIGLLPRTQEFRGIPTNDDHPYAVAFETIYPWMSDRLSARFGRAIDGMINYGHVSFLSSPNRSARAIRRSNPWGWAEVWLMYRGYAAPTRGSLRAITYEHDYEKAIAEMVRQTRAGARRILGARDLAGGAETGSDRGRIFLLSLYYLVANDNTYFLYETVNDHAGTTGFPGWQWNPAATYNIGSPAPIPEGFVDFAGAAGTREHYVFDEGPDPANPTLTYRILARRYTNALVLAKMLPEGSTVNSPSATTHVPGGTFRPLLPDGSLGTPVTSVSLRNNEAAILIPVN